MAKATSRSKEGSRLWAFLAYLLNILFIPLGFVLVYLIKKDDRFAMYHAKQSLVLWIAGVIVSVGSMIPVLGWFIIAPVGSILLLIVWIVGMVNALSGKEKPLWLIGKFADKLDF